MSGKSAAINTTSKAGRNDPCPCGSGRKYKHCCQPKELAAESASKGKAQALAQAGKRRLDAGRLADAIATFREVVRLDPASADAHCNLGVAYSMSGRWREAATSLQRAVELRHGFDKALRLLAEVLEHVGQNLEAANAYRRLSRTAEDGAERRLLTARADLLEGKQEEAEEELRRAIAAAPGNAGARVLLGQLLLEQGAFEEGERQLMEVLEVLPDAFHRLSGARRMTEADRPLVERMRRLLERADLNPIQRGTVHFGLGKAFDDLGDAAEAMRHFEAGNRLASGSRRLNRTGLVEYYDSLIADFSAEALARAERPGTTALPGGDLPVLIVGMPRSGTTLTEQILSSHPSVAAGGELRFWGRQVSEWRFPPSARAERLPLRLGLVEADELARAAGEYRAVLRPIGPKALRVTDKEPHNFDQLGLIWKALPDARVIHCRRRPIDVCLSIYFNFFNGKMAWDRADLVFQYRQYERLMEHWRNVLPADFFTEVEYETLVADREAETRRLVAFCGLEWDDACLAPERNARRIKTASLWQARQPVYRTSLERWRRYEPWLGELRELLPEAERSADAKPASGIPASTLL
jgi:tetratricopeptide (TPR) repeat protein